MPANRLRNDTKEEYLRQLRSISISGEQLVGPKITASDVYEVFQECTSEAVRRSIAIIEETHPGALNDMYSRYVNISIAGRGITVLLANKTLTNLGSALYISEDSLLYNKWTALHNEFLMCRHTVNNFTKYSSHLVREATTTAQIQRVWPELHATLAGGKYKGERAGRVPSGFGMNSFLKEKPKLDMYLATYTLMRNSDQPEPEGFIIE